MSKRSDPWRSRGIFMMVTLFVGGCISIGVGISNVHHAGQISRHGVTVNATVIQNQGWGPYSVRVRYVTAAGQQEQGTLDTPAAAGSYPVGSAITVIYDRYSPSVVTLPGSGDSNGWIEIGIGAFALLLPGTVAGWGWLRGRQRRHGELTG